MYNSFIDKRKIQRSAESLINKERLKQKFRKLKMQELAEKSDRRVNQWMNKLSEAPEVENCQHGTYWSEFWTNYHQGAIPLVHEQHHQFKEYDKRHQLTKRDFYNYNYKTDKERVKQTVIINKNSLLKKNLYEYVDRTKNWLRKRRNNLEIQKPMKFSGNNTDKERMDWHFKMMPPTDSVVVPTENKFYIDPKWKVTNPKKWISNQDFKTGRSLGWSIKTNSNKEMYEPHIDGFEVTGDTLIKRNKLKEVSTDPFVSTIQPWKSINLNKNGFMTTQSIRSYKSCQSLFTTISPDKIRSKSKGKHFDSMNYNFDDTIPIEIKIHPGVSLSTERQISVTTKPKTTMSKNQHFGSIDDLEIRHTKFYLKSIQSKMINPKSKPTRGHHTRRGSMDNAFGRNIYNFQI